MVVLHLDLRGLRKSLCILLFLCGVAIPLVLLFLANSHDFDRTRPSEAQSALLTRDTQYFSHERKPLDYSESRDGSEALRFQIREMQQIKISVQNELRQLEKERTDLNREVQTFRDNLSLVKKQLTLAKIDLQESKSKLAKVHREANRGSKGGIAPIVNPAPIVFVNMPPREKSLAVPNTVSSNHSCTYEECFDFSRCPLSNTFSVYVYNMHSPFNSQFVLKYPKILDQVIASLSDKHTITDDPDRACVLVVVVGPLKTPEPNLQERLKSLSHWGKDGANHVVLDLSDEDKPLSSFKNRLTNRAVFASVYSQRTNYDIILAPVLSSIDPPNHLWKGLPPHLPAFRPVLLYFEGASSSILELGENEGWISAIDIETIKHAIIAKSTDKIKIETSCLHSDISRNSNGGLLGEWKLCGNYVYRKVNLTKSTFSLILGSRSGLSGTATYTRLIEALQFGSIPVLLGVKSLPFESVIDWKRAAIRIPTARVGGLHYILRNIQPNSILEYRRQGRFLWETYFSSAKAIVDTVFAIVRYRSYHPPPSAKDWTDAKPLVTLPGSSKPIIAPVHQQNYSVYRTEFWNRPPGPFYMYPLTPFTSGPVSGSQYEGLTPEQVSQLPAHVIQAGGITGPFFQDYLLGNTPEEQFTIVMLTYERNTVLMEAVRRLDGLDGLAKVVVVWNSPSPPSEVLNWPSIEAPVEVVTMGRNSLNNRFLPLANIQTEAVLSIDDDVHLRHDEIQFAFRVWREARDRIVGFPGRFHAWDVRHSSWLYNSNYTCELSMVLTGAAFLHKYYLYLYSQWMPSAIRDIVDEYVNCEDIAMNFLVSHITRKPPLKVTSRWTFRCPGCPENLSSNDEHFNERHICMNKFVEIFGYMPLLYTQFRLDSVLFKTRLPSHLEKCYQFV